MTPPGSRISPNELDIDIADTLDLWNFRNIASALGPVIDNYARTFSDPECPIDPSDRDEMLDDLLGLLLVAVQSFLVSVARFAGQKKGKVLGLGPRHSCGESKVGLLNDLANFWKHADEWDWDALEPRAKKTLAVFQKVGSEEAAIAQVLVAILETDVLDYSVLEQVLRSWRDEVDALEI